MGRVYVVGTADTKREELDYVRERIARAGHAAALVDVGIGPTTGVDISNHVIAKSHPEGEEFVFSRQTRGEALDAMGLALTRYLSQQNDIDGVIGIGGSGNTGMVTRAMRSLPVGLPKVMVSTIASGDVSTYVGSSDINMISSITDIAGLNRINRLILGNAATAIAAMAANPVCQTPSERPEIGLTQFGVTTPCIDGVRAHLSREFDCISFHATGTGGRAMEQLVASGLIEGVLDLTTTEIADHIVGGVLSAGEERLNAVRDTGVPCVLSLGALDVVNFWSRESVPPQFAERTFHKHNPEVTLMRTSEEECEKIGRWIGGKLNSCRGHVKVLAPMNGFSALDIDGGPFWDPAADQTLVEALASEIAKTSNVELIKVNLHINDKEFALRAANLMREMVLQSRIQ